MKIFADSFKRWVRVLETYQAKGDPIGESLYLNFKDKYAYFGSQEGIGRVKFYVEGEEDITNFFISTNKFLNIITQYDFINLDSKFIFTFKDDKYKIPVIVDDEKFNNAQFLKNFENSFDFEKSTIDLISKASTFTNKDEQNINYRNVFIQDGYICALTTPTPLYESKIGIQDKIALPLNVAKTLCQIGIISEGCKLLVCENNKKIVSRDDEIELIVPAISSTEFPVNRNKEFVDSYSYPTTIEFSYDDFNKVIKSLRPYFNDVLNAKMYILINEKDVEVQVIDSQNEIIKHCEFVTVAQDLIGKKYAISGTKVEQALSVINGKKLIVALPTDDGHPIVNFFNDESQHVLIVRFQQWLAA